MRNGYFKLEMAGEELYWFIHTVEEAIDHPGEFMKFVDGGVTFAKSEDGDPFKDRFTFRLPPQFVYLISKGFKDCIDNDGIPTKVIESHLTYVKAVKGEKYD